MLMRFDHLKRREKNTQIETQMRWHQTNERTEKKRSWENDFAIINIKKTHRKTEVNIICVYINVCAYTQYTIRYEPFDAVFTIKMMWVFRNSVDAVEMMLFVCDVRKWMRSVLNSYTPAKIRNLNGKKTLNLV